MRVRVWSGFLFAGMALVCAAVAPSEPAGAQAPSAAAALTSNADAIKQYCFGCHNTRVKSGGLALDDLDLANIASQPETWEKVIRKLRVGAMPPQGTRRPDAATYQRLVGWLEGDLDRAGRARPDPGRPLLRRLNRAEYANAIRDLIGLEIDASSLLPPDDAAFGFDNVADAQTTSPALLQAYLTAARKISAMVVGDPRAGVDSRTYSVRQDLSQDHHLDGLPLGTVGGLSTRHTFPLDGEYEFQVRLYRTTLSAIRGLEDPQELELSVDGGRLLVAPIGGDQDLEALQKNPTSASDELEAKRLFARATVTAGQRTVVAAFIDKTPQLLDTNRLQRFIRDFDPFDAEGAPHVQSITIQGPFSPAPLSSRVSSTLFVCNPARASEERSCARRILNDLAMRAYGRPPTSLEIESVMSFYADGRAKGSFQDGIRFGLRRILSSPPFMFRPEREPSTMAAGSVYRITDFELASRLALFLWSSIPDDELLRAARQGALTQPAVLERQVRRMIADPRARALVENFAGQWLHLRNLTTIVPTSDTYPDFDDNLRQAFRREAELFVGSIVADDRNVLDLMTANHTFVNERLARHYGIPGVVGSYFRKVTLTDQRRHGLLGKGAVLLATSHADRTSPVSRGKWVLENVLGTPPPPPPGDLDTTLKEGAPGAAPRTMRERMEQHRLNPVCASCHKTMDPIGFVLENFDVVGAWRTADRAGNALDTTDVLADGKRVSGVVELRRALTADPTLFVQTLTEKLLLYGIGRGLTAKDMPVARAIVRQASRQDYRFSSLVLGIVSSVPFQMRMKPVDAGVGGQARLQESP